jgi:hypothetical protein
LANVPDGALAKVDANGDLVVLEGGVEVQRVPRCTGLTWQSTGVKSASGWVASSNQEAPTEGTGWFKRIHGEWTVPPAPTAANGQLIYMFNSLMPADYSRIIQPVLQWGVSPAGGGDYWSVASWDVIDAHTGFHSSLLRVEPGDRIVGDAYAENCSADGDCIWTIIVQSPSGESVLRTEAGAKIFGTAQPGVLEAYNVKSCQELPPAPLTFTNTEHWAFDVDGERIEVTDASPWKPIIWPDFKRALDCGYTVDISGRTTTLGYHD